MIMFSEVIKLMKVIEMFTDLIVSERKVLSSSPDSNQGLLIASHPYTPIDSQTGTS